MKETNLVLNVLHCLWLKLNIKVIPCCKKNDMIIWWILIGMDACIQKQTLCCDLNSMVNGLSTTMRVYQEEFLFHDAIGMGGRWPCVGILLH